MNHGTDGCYHNHKCRCDDCVEAHAEAMWEYRQDNQTRIYARQKARLAERRQAS